MSFIENPKQFAGRSAITTWLYSATTHLCLNKIRNRKNRLRLVDTHVSKNDTAPARAEQLAEVRALLARLPEDLAEVVIYYYLDEMTHDEIAEVIGCSRRQVGYLLERAQNLIQEAVA